LFYLLCGYVLCIAIVSLIPGMNCVHVVLTMNIITKTEMYTLSLHDALPISPARQDGTPGTDDEPGTDVHPGRTARRHRADRPPRSEEHTSELQSRFDLVCRLLLEKKKILA